MKIRTCPECGFTFKKSKVMGGIRTCPSCKTELYYEGEDTILLKDKPDRREENSCAKDLVFILEDHISKRDDINFEFEGPSWVKEICLAYQLIDRAKRFLARQVDIGMSPLSFCKEIILDILHDDFWGKIIQSMAMFMKYVSGFAAEVFKRHKKDLDQKAEDEEVSGFSDFLSYSDEGATPCYQVPSI